uniref:Uncharacterized protein n=1 Tax=Anguilla anguilla TaxID=7936 RepID=A0A0E9P953_ANGAN
MTITCKHLQDVSVSSRFDGTSPRPESDKDMKISCSTGLCLITSSIVSVVMPQ